MDIGQFEQMAGLASGGRAGVQHAHPVGNLAERRGKLGAGILY
jgi:hypothetical protein